MSWGVIDNVASKPAYLSTDSNAPQGDQRDNCFGVDADEVAAATDDGKGGISQGFVVHVPQGAVPLCASDEICIL